MESQLAWSTLIFTSLIAFGIWYILGRSKITQAAREAVYGVDLHRAGSLHRPRFFLIRRWLVDLIECPGCTGVWIGMILGGVLFKLPWTLWIIGGLYLCSTNLILFHLTGLDRPE